MRAPRRQDMMSQHARRDDYAFISRSRHALIFIADDVERLFCRHETTVRRGVIIRACALMIRGEKV